MRVDHAVARGVPLPSAWPTALRCFDLHQFATHALANYDPPTTVEDLHDLRCRCLGACKPIETRRCDGILASGACVALRNEIGARVNYLLVAQEEGDNWFCHPGMFRGDLPIADEFFHESRLVRKNIHLEA